MSTHKILETLIRHTTFRTEAEQHELLDLLDSSVEHDDAPEGAVARTSWKPPVPRDASGQPIAVPTGMTSQQADELIGLLRTQQVPRNVVRGENSTLQEDAPTPDVPTRPVTAADVPEGVS